MAILGNKEKKLNKRRKKQQEYLNDVGHRIRTGDVPTYAQYLRMSETAKRMLRSGIGYKKIKKMGG